MKIAGYKKVDFKADNNVTINGYTVYFFDDFSKQSNFIERGCFFEKAFLSKNKFDDLNVHKIFEEQKEITLLYNKYGKIERFI